LARNITKKLDVNVCSLAHLTLVLSLHYLADAYATEYEFIVVNGQTTTSALYKVV